MTMKVLPVQFQRCIFELAATSDLKTALSLVKISKAVKKWVNPFLYEVVVLDNERKLLAFLRTIKTAPLYATYVKTLQLKQDYKASSEDIAKVLSSCSAVSWLALWVPFEDPEDPVIGILHSGVLTQLERFSGRIELLSSEEKSFSAHPFCHNLTHLDVMFTDAFPFQFSELDLSTLKGLTHLSVEFCSGMGDWLIEKSLQDILSYFSGPESKLEVVLVCAPYLGYSCDREWMDGSADVRVVFRSTEDPEEYVDDDTGEHEWAGVVMHCPEFDRTWGYMDPDEMDMWEEAENFIWERLNGGDGSDEEEDGGEEEIKAEEEEDDDDDDREEEYN